MKNTLQKIIGEATALARRGRLEQAGAAIQRGLRDASAGALKNGALPGGVGLALDLFGGLPGTKPLQPVARRPGAAAANDALRKPPETDGVGAHFLRGTYAGPAGSREYKLFVPSGAAAGEALSLVVMLHGCTQNPDDFAAGTRMNELAEETGFLVLYPAQAPRSNVSKCWNWFMPGDQQRGRGEPALLAGMTEEIAARQEVDPDRIYVAGLSAGGAMAAIMAREYPELFAAVGIHSGLPQGAAHDVASAFAAMKSGSPEAATAIAAAASDRDTAGSGDQRAVRDRQAAAASGRGAAPNGRRSRAATPTIVFHGDRDATVHPSNGTEVISALLGDLDAAPSASGDGAPSANSAAATSGHGGAVESSGSRGSAAGRDFTRTVYRRRGAAANDASLAEHWLIHGAGHAWSGGSPRGSYTDAQGPDASREMLRFFSEHPRRHGERH